MKKISSILGIILEWAVMILFIIAFLQYAIYDKQPENATIMMLIFGSFLILKIKP